MRLAGAEQREHCVIVIRREFQWIVAAATDHRPFYAELALDRRAGDQGHA
jgi:hypothetical protein